MSILSRNNLTHSVNSQKKKTQTGTPTMSLALGICALGLATAYTGGPATSVAPVGAAEGVTMHRNPLAIFSSSGSEEGEAIELITKLKPSGKPGHQLQEKQKSIFDSDSDDSFGPTIRKFKKGPSGPAGPSAPPRQQLQQLQQRRKVPGKKARDGADNVDVISALSASMEALHISGVLDLVPDDTNAEDTKVEDTKPSSESAAEIPEIPEEPERGPERSWDSETKWFGTNKSAADLWKENYEMYLQKQAAKAKDFSTPPKDEAEAEKLYKEAQRLRDIFGKNEDLRIAEQMLTRGIYYRKLVEKFFPPELEYAKNGRSVYNFALWQSHFLVDTKTVKKTAKADREHILYLLFDNKGNRYIGQSDNFARRMKEHNKAIQKAAEGKKVGAKYKVFANSRWVAALVIRAGISSGTSMVPKEDPKFFSNIDLAESTLVKHFGTNLNTMLTGRKSIRDLTEEEKKKANERYREARRAVHSSKKKK